MTILSVWRLYHYPCVASTCLRIFVQNNVTTSGVLNQMVQLDLHKDFDLSRQFSYDEFPLENNILISCKKGLISHFILDQFACFHYYFGRYFNFVYDYITLRYPYQAVIIKCYPCYRKSIKQLKS